MPETSETTGPARILTDPEKELLGLRIAGIVSDLEDISGALTTALGEDVTEEEVQALREGREVPDRRRDLADDKALRLLVFAHDLATDAETIAGHAEAIRQKSCALIHERPLSPTYWPDLLERMARWHEEQAASRREGRTASSRRCLRPRLRRRLATWPARGEKSADRTRRPTGCRARLRATSERGMRGDAFRSIVPTGGGEAIERVTSAD